MAEVALQRVLRVLAAALRVRDRHDPLGQEARARLPSTSGLTEAGVELALREHLETDASPEELSAFLARAARARRCHVVVSANVCTGALRAIAFAVATADEVFVRPSRRDPVMAELIVRALAEDPAFGAAAGVARLVEEVAPSPGDELHVYGSDETVAALSAAHPEALVRGHATGLGVSVIAADGDEALAASALARDVVPFDQRGCLSPRFALVEGDARRAERFAERLHVELEAFQQRVPRGALDEATRAELASYGRTAAAVGRAWEGSGHLVGLDVAPRVLPLPPAARAVHVIPAFAASARALLRPFERWITAIGVAGGGALVADVCARSPGARRSELGWMQRPPFDGPVDLRGIDDKA